jgi:multicomponent Na+:H+ antiporter subunit D
VTQPWIAWTVVVPLAGAVVALVAGARWGRWIGLATAPATLATTLGLVSQVLREGVVRHRVGGWGAPLGIDLFADGLSAVMVLMTGAVGLGVSLHAFAYFDDHPAPAEPPSAPASRRLLFWPLWLFLWGALDALFLSRDLFNVYVTLELVGLSAVGLVALSGDRGALGAAARYLVLALVGSLFYLLGVGLLYSGLGVLDVDGVRAALRPGLLATAAGALVFGGLAVKGALFPLHGWLPPAHAQAPSPVSAVLSALVVKAAFYLLVRWSTAVLPPPALPRAELLLGLLGAGAILWGSLQALRQERLKQVIAYSTVAQLGYLFLFFPLSSGAGAGPALAGAAVFALAHALAKSALFLAAGSILHALPSDRLDALGGLGARMPVTAATLGLASVSIVALPPSGGFAGKWFLLGAAVRGGDWGWVAVMVVGGLLATAYSLRVMERLVASDPGETTRAHAPAAMEYAALALAVASLAVGAAPWAPLRLLAAGTALGGLAP